MARPRKLNATKTGNHNKEELEYQELKENGLKRFEKIDTTNIPIDLTEEGKKNGIALFLYFKIYQLPNLITIVLNDIVS